MIHINAKVGNTIVTTCKSDIKSDNDIDSYEVTIENNINAAASDFWMKNVRIISEKMS